MRAFERRRDNKAAALVIDRRQKNRCCGLFGDALGLRLTRSLGPCYGHNRVGLHSGSGSASTSLV